MRTALVYAVVAGTLSVAGLARAAEVKMPEITGPKAELTIKKYDEEKKKCLASPGGTEAVCEEQAKKYASVYAESYLDCMEKKELVCEEKAEKKASSARGPQIEVQNGSGTPGDAAVCKTLLEISGFPVAHLGPDIPEKNRSDETYIEFKDANKDLAPKLEEVLGKKYVVSSTRHLLNDSDAYDVRIITGRKRVGETPAAARKPPEKKKEDKKEPEKKKEAEKKEEPPAKPEEKPAPPAEPQGPVDCEKAEYPWTCRNAIGLSRATAVPFIRGELAGGMYISPLDRELTPHLMFSLPAFGAEFDTDFGVNFAVVVAPRLGGALVRDPIYSMMFHGGAAGLKVTGEVDFAPLMHRPFPRSLKDGDVAKRLRFGGRLSGEVLFTDFRPETITRLQLVGRGFNTLLPTVGVFARVDVFPSLSLIGYWDIVGVGLKTEAVTKGTFAPYPGLPYLNGSAGIMLQGRFGNTVEFWRNPSSLFGQSDETEVVEHPLPKQPREKPKEEGEKVPTPV